MARYPSRLFPLATIVHPGVHFAKRTLHAMIDPTPAHRQPEPGVDPPSSAEAGAEGQVVSGHASGIVSTPRSSPPSRPARA